MWTWRPDVVHAWHWMPALAGVPACHALGIPLVDGSIRMGSIPRSLGRPRRSIMRWATLVVANSRAGLDAWRVGPEKGRVIYNAFDDARLRDVPGRARVSAHDHGRFAVVMAARMHAQKDYRAVIQAARLLELESPGAWRFVLVGDGPDRTSLMADARDLIATGAVTFRDAGIEAIDDIRAAEVGILMTDPTVLAEGCSNSILEYMSCGLPVVCSDTGGSAELIRDGREGYVIAAYDSVALAARLRQFRDDPELRTCMGAAGRTRIAQEFTIDRMVTQYLDVYDEAMNRGGKRPTAPS